MPRGQRHGGRGTIAALTLHGRLALTGQGCCHQANRVRPGYGRIRRARVRPEGTVGPRQQGRPWPYGHQGHERDERVSSDRDHPEFLNRHYSTPDGPPALGDGSCKDRGGLYRRRKPGPRTIPGLHGPARRPVRPLGSGARSRRSARVDAPSRYHNCGAPALEPVEHGLRARAPEFCQVLLFSYRLWGLLCSWAGPRSWYAGPCGWRTATRAGAASSGHRDAAWAA